MITLGDNLYYPDYENDAANLLGKAITVIGPGKNIDCDSCLRKLQGKLIVKTYKLRPFIFFLSKSFEKIRVNHFFYVIHQPLTRWHSTLTVA